jgi:hypothetical protein
MKTPITLLTLAALPCAVLAADVTGVWKSEFDSQIGLQKYTYTLKQDGMTLAGKANSEVGERKADSSPTPGKSWPPPTREFSVRSSSTAPTMSTASSVTTLGFFA